MREKWILTLLCLGVIASLASIFLANILLAAALGVWIADCLAGRCLKVSWPPFALPFAAYALATIASMAFSPQPWVSAINLKKLLLFSSAFLLTTYLTRRAVKMTMRGAYALLAFSSSWAILQYFWLLEISPVNRVRGLMSHWMTFSAQLMIGIVSMLALLAFYIWRHPKRNRLRDVLCLLTLALMSAAILLSQTRNAWLGTAAGVLFVSAVFGFRFLPARGAWAKNPWRFLYGFRWAAAAAVLLALLVLAMPPRYRERLRAGFDPTDYTTGIRIELLKTGVNMVAEHPWAGIGPRMVPQRYDRYNTTDEYPPEIYQHLHNNFVQIAAESGIPALLAWMLMWAVVALWLVKLGLRAGNDRFLFFASANGLAVLLAFLVAGMLEYNFGDSEVVILLLFFLAAPYAVERDPDTREVHAQRRRERREERPEASPPPNSRPANSETAPAGRHAP